MLVQYRLIRPLSSGRCGSHDKREIRSDLMKAEDMLSLLKSLQEELSSADSLDPEHRKSLQALTSEIQETLAKGAIPNPAATATLSQRMKESVIEFEVRHPIIGG
ncbi:MAG TPA: DUF4404 family protein, partial [Planctomycetaceae bacterium]|nr:DUF4404 family protein [Planctomycetaceae bacterium]